MKEYQSLMDAAQITGKAQYQVGHDDGPNVISPAYRILRHVTSYLTKQAEIAMRGEEEAA